MCRLNGRLTAIGFRKLALKPMFRISGPLKKYPRIARQ